MASLSFYESIYVCVYSTAMYVGIYVCVHTTDVVPMQFCTHSYTYHNAAGVAITH